MKRLALMAGALALALHFTAANLLPATGPFDGKRFKGRIAWSADGNHNDPDDWMASPVALAIFAQAGVKDRLVHFDYNSILPKTDPDWEKKHAASVLGAAERYGYDKSRFHDCRKNLDAAVASIAKAINDSSAGNPLYFVIAGPMEVPFRGIQKSDPKKRRFVYCISHSAWNDGFAPKYTFTHTKRSVIESGVRWVQIQGQNPLLAFGRFGQPAKPEEFRPYFWMRDSDDPRVRFLWERTLVSTRPDPSDAGMAYFLVSGDEQADPAKLERLLNDGVIPAPIAERTALRIEAEDFQQLEGYELEFRNDRQASHRINLKPADGSTTGRIRTRLDQPYSAAAGQYDVDVRYFDEPGSRCRLALLVNGKRQGGDWQAPGLARGWQTHTVHDVRAATGDSIALEVKGGSLARLDYVQLNRKGALPGQLIVAGAKPGYLRYNGGGPAFLSGPDNPEDFLFRGTLNPDGTRSGGGQEELIDRMARNGVNAFHFLLFRMQRCNYKNEGDDTHSPFIGHDPAKGLNEAVLNQWEGWLDRLEQKGINVHLEFYNDATDVERMGWTLDAAGNLHRDEHRFIEGIVKRFKHHKNILWGIEESCNKLPAARTKHFKKIAEVIARADNHNHPIVQSFVVPNDPEKDFPKDGILSDAYAGDPNIRVVTWLHVVPNGEDLEAQHREYLKYYKLSGADFVVMKNETFHHPRSGPIARKYMWSAAMAGLHTLESYLAADKAPEETLRDIGRIRIFMEQTDFHSMKPRDELAAGSTNWVLADPGRSYIAYGYACTGPMGIKNLTAGVYDLLWYDTVTGEKVVQKGVKAGAGEALWPKPSAFGAEIALYVRRAGAR